MRAFLLSLFTLALPLTSSASTMFGHPPSGITVISGNPVYVDAIEAFRCGSGSQMISIKETIGKGGFESFTYDQDEFCSITVHLKWTPNGPLESIDVGGFDSLKVVSGASLVEIELDQIGEAADLN